MAQAQEAFISKAILTNFRVSPQKARLVVDLVRGKKVDYALSVLATSTKKSAPVLEKLILSAVANAKNEHSDVDIDDLFIKSIWVCEGRRLMRSMPRARGTANKIIKRSSTITVLLDEK
jgi:large subunit ribosomal protein L22